MKKLAIVLAAAMLVSAVIAGCGNNGQAAGEETAAETQAQAAAAETETKESILAYIIDIDNVAKLCCAVNRLCF